MAAQDLAPNIGSAGKGPSSVSGDAGSVTQQPLQALAAADRYLAQKSGRATRNRGLLFSKLIPAGAMPDSQGTGFGGLGGFGSPGGVY